MWENMQRVSIKLVKLIVYSGNIQCEGRSDPLLEWCPEWCKLQQFHGNKRQQFVSVEYLALYLGVNDSTGVVLQRFNQ